MKDVIMLSVIGQTQKDKDCLGPLTGVPYRSPVPRDRE